MFKCFKDTINIWPIAVKIRFDQQTVGDGPICKGKETFTFAGGGWRGSESQKIMSAGLRVQLFGVYAVKWRNMVA